MHNNDFPRAFRKANCSLACATSGVCDKSCDSEDPIASIAVPPQPKPTPGHGAEVPGTGPLRPTIRGPLETAGRRGHLRDYIEGVLNSGALPGAPGKDTNPKDAIGDKKVPLWLLSAVAKAHWAAAQFCGMAKYGAWNWRSAGVRSSVYISAMERHIDAYKEGEDLDPVDGTKHLGNIMACAAILMDAEAAGKLTDDRPPKQPAFRKAYAEVEALMSRLRTQYAHLSPKHHTALTA